MGLRGRAVWFGPRRRGARREVKRSGAEQSNGSAGKAKLTAGPGCCEMSGARAGVWSGPGRVRVGPRGESEGVGCSERRGGARGCAALGRTRGAEWAGEEREDCWAGFYLFQLFSISKQFKSI